MRQAAWQRLVQAPGVAGQDYDPEQIMVSYVPGATEPAGWMHRAPTAGAGASAQPNPQLRENKSFESLSDALAARYGLRIAQQVYRRDLNFASFTLPAGMDGAALLTRLRNEAASQIEAAVFLPLSHASYVPSDPDFAAGKDDVQWDKWRVGCDRVWDATLGDPAVIIGVVDTGVRLTHEELSAQVIDPELAFPAATCDLADNDKSMEDIWGHGTFIAGMICAQADNNRTIVGAAPHCRVLPIKISNTNVAGISDLIAGALLADQLGAKVVNYSWGSHNNIPAEQAMVDQLTTDGILFVTAAGNDSTFDVQYPGVFDNALCVGATDKDDNAAQFSDWGTGVDIAAPGMDLKSCSYVADDLYDTSGNGTSYAAPLVASAAALLWSYNASLTVAQVRTALTVHGAAAHNFGGNAKRLDILQALNAVAEPPPTITGLTPDAPLTAGLVADLPEIDLQVQGASHVTRVEYRLDLAPLGTDGPEDLTATSTSGGTFPVHLDVGKVHNQMGILHVDFFNALDKPGTRQGSTVWIFNQRGDIDGDGVVGLSDLSTLRALIGKQAGATGYTGYADSDLDGTITESDAAAIGYNFGAGS